jgi:competence protein ComEC
MVVSHLPKNKDVSQYIRKLESLRESYSAQLKPHDPYGVFRKLILNESMPQSPVGMMQKIGFVHLLTSAGIHLYALSHWNSLICFHFFRRIRFPAPMALTLTRIFNFGTWVWVWLLNGIRPGMLRPWLLVILQAAGQRLGFRWKLWTPLFLAMFLDILFGGVLSQQGRWFYILAVGGGFLSRGDKRHFHIRLSISSWILAALWEAWEQGLVALATPVLSLLSIPVFALFTFPGILTALLFSSDGLLHWICILSENFIFFSLKAALFLGTLWLTPTWSIPVGIFLAGIVFVIDPRYRKRAAVFLVGICFTIRFLKPPSEFKIEQLDVGQGDSALVRSSDLGLIDTGSRRALSDESWITLFASRNVNHLSWIALTHLDEDHAGASAQLARLMPIRCVSTSFQELQEDRGMKLIQTLAESETHLASWDSHCVPHFVYQPDFKRSKKRNRNMSAVLVPLPKGGFYLSAGDADSEDEIKIAQWVHLLPIKKAGERILKISHHGSRFSTSPSFLSLIAPTQAWISVGRGNPYKHPTVETLRLLGISSVPTLRTDRIGSISN